MIFRQDIQYNNTIAAALGVAREKCTTGGADRKNWTLTVRKRGVGRGERVEMLEIHLEMAGVVPFRRCPALDTTGVDTSTAQDGEGVSCVLVVRLATRLRGKRVSLPLGLTFRQAKIFHQPLDNTPLRDVELSGISSPRRPLRR